MICRQALTTSLVRCLLLALPAGGCGETETETATTTATTSETETTSDTTSATDAPTGTSASEACNAPDAPTWDNFGAAFFTTYCNHCHSETLKGDARNEAPYDRNFDTVELIRTQLHKIGSVAAAGPDGINNSMPRGEPKPGDAERITLGAWLDCGAP